MDRWRWTTPGSYLYVGVTGGPDLYSEYSVMTFQVNHETGALEFLGETPFHGQDTTTIHFTGNDKYAFDEHNYEYLVAGNKTLLLLGNATDAGFDGNYLDTDPLSNLAVLGKNGQLQSWFVHCQWKPVAALQRRTNAGAHQPMAV